MVIDKNEINNIYSFPKSNFENIDIEKEILLAKNIIYKTQKNSNDTSNCYLSFYPLAKNLRFLSTHYFKSIKSMRRPILSNESRPGEDSFWLHMTGKSWYPWLWTRYQTGNLNEKISDSWKRLFCEIEDEIEIDSFLEDSQINISDFYLYITCLGHIFRMNDIFEKNLLDKYLIELPQEKICALQIRRGEIVASDGDINNAWKIRKLYTIDEYMQSAIKICEVLNTNNIFISSDSSETYDYLTNKYRGYNFFMNKYDRNLFVRFQGDPSKVNLERDLQENPSLIEHYTESCLIDLYTLSKCHGYVGGMKDSEYGVCGWLLQIFQNKKITPYFNIEGEFKIDGYPVGLLLN
jgi:hypothetical protein